MGIVKQGTTWGRLLEDRLTGGSNLGQRVFKARTHTGGISSFRKNCKREQLLAW